MLNTTRQKQRVKLIHTVRPLSQVLKSIFKHTPLAYKGNIRTTLYFILGTALFYDHPLQKSLLTIKEKH